METPLSSRDCPGRRVFAAPPVRHSRAIAGLSTSGLGALMAITGLVLAGCGAADPADTPPQSAQQLKAMLLTLDEYGLEGAEGPGQQMDPSLTGSGLVDDPSSYEGECGDALEALEKASFDTTASAAEAVSAMGDDEGSYFQPAIFSALFAQENADGPEPGALYTAIAEGCQGVEMTQGGATVTVEPLPGDRDGLVAHSTGDETFGDADVVVALETIGHHHIMVSGILVDTETVVAAFDRQVVKVREALVEAQ